MITLTYIIAFFIIVIFGVLFYANVVLPFKSAKSYIEMELSRAFNDEQRRYWKRQLRNLYVERIPIIGPYLIDE